MHLPTFRARTVHMLEHQSIRHNPIERPWGVLKKNVDQHEPLWDVWGSVQGFFGRSGRADQPDNV